MYHVDHWRQSAIAKHLCISQAKVSRMLKKAQQEGIVRTSVAAPVGTYSELEKQLREKFQLPEAIVVDCNEDNTAAIMSRIGEAAAHFIEISLQKDEVIGVSSWSETILKMVDNIHPMKTGRARAVIQMLGGVGNPSTQKHATLLTTRLAQLTGAQAHLLNVHGIAESQAARQALLSDRYVEATIERFTDITLAIIGIGALRPSSMLVDSGNVFSQAELAALANAGAVGDMSLRFFDIDGHAIQTALADRVIGISIEALRRVDRVIAVAGGKMKTKALIGALNVGIIDVLITDRFSAERMLQYHQK